MGVSYTGILAYGYNLGYQDDHFDLGVDVYDDRDEPDFSIPGAWATEYWDDDEDAAQARWGTGYDGISDRAASEMLLLQGYDSSEFQDYQRHRELINGLPVELVQYGHYDYPGYILSAVTHERDIHYPTPLAPELTLPYQANETLAFFMVHALGFRVEHREPSWILTARAS